MTNIGFVPLQERGAFGRRRIHILIPAIAPNGSGPMSLLQFLPNFRLAFGSKRNWPAIQENVMMNSVDKARVTDQSQVIIKEEGGSKVGPKNANKQDSEFP
jgi:hypothetical protein